VAGAQLQIELGAGGACHRLVPLINMGWLLLRSAGRRSTAGTHWRQSDASRRLLRAIDLVVVNAATARGVPLAPLPPADGQQQKECSGSDQVPASA
jgi:hypothetical protein